MGKSPKQGEGYHTLTERTIPELFDPEGYHHEEKEPPTRVTPQFLGKAAGYD